MNRFKIKKIDIELVIHQTWMGIAVAIVLVKPKYKNVDGLSVRVFLPSTGRVKFNEGSVKLPIT